MPATRCTLTSEQAIYVQLATEALQASKDDHYPGDPRKHQVVLEFHVGQLLTVITGLTGARS